MRHEMVRGGLVLVLLCGAWACAAEPPPPRQPPTAEPTEEFIVPQTPWSLRYADGSGNVTRLWHDAGASAARLETTPVTPETSSSGSYSGGEPRAGELTPAEVEGLWSQFRGIEADETIRAEARTMGSGSFSGATPAGEFTLLVKRCDRLAAFDTYLESLGER